MIGDELIRLPRVVVLWIAGCVATPHPFPSHHALKHAGSHAGAQDSCLARPCYSNRDCWVAQCPDESTARLASNRNQVRRSVSSIQTSIRLALAMSLCSSHTPCTSRRLAASALLSSRNSASMSDGSTYSASLSFTLCNRPTCPVDLISCSPCPIRRPCAPARPADRTWRTADPPAHPAAGDSRGSAARSCASGSSSSSCRWRRRQPE